MADTIAAEEAPRNRENCQNQNRSRLGRPFDNNLWGTIDPAVVIFKISAKP